jgi:hypothetical protein
MSLAIKETPSSAAHSNRADTSRTDYPDAGLPRCVLDGHKFRSRGSEDEVLFGRWRLGLFAFYSALALLLVGGFAVVADRPGNQRVSTD